MAQPLLAAAQMRALERAAIDSGAVSGLELMERAGAGTVAATLLEWPDLRDGPHRAVVLCGPGNNGGDGYVVARLLRARGWGVACFLYGDPAKLPPDARTNYERWVTAGGKDPAPIEQAIDELEGATPTLIVDALFGTGLTRPVSALGGLLGAVSEVIRMRPHRVAGRAPAGDWPRLVAIDVPSGLCADSGRVLGRDPAVEGGGPEECLATTADLTCAFHALKLGHVLADGVSRCGRTRVIDIGLGNDRDGSEVTLIDGAPRLAKRQGHKFSHGHALILAGGVGRGGAARLAARAALRVGAGLVTVAPPPAALIENACRLDAIMLRALRDADAFAELLRDDRLSALCLGPGLGLGEREAALVAGAVSSGLPTVLDADALTLIARDPGLAGMVHDRCVLTPHMGEFARLAPDLAARLTSPAESGPAYSKLDAARDLAARLGATVLLKGPDTVIAAPSGRAAIHSAASGREAPWLATAGAGDVLAGLVGGLLARGFDPMAACEAAAWLHVEAARSFGPGLIAEDLPEMLPKILCDMEKGEESRVGSTSG
ncbi:NAD(P)H-hydrate dehydratase [Jannaschia seohaensis]|uniref:Bifunctional NAD(P)H-hydrate repair enzyme n=1 Tax=Jannaschia seohaensis TaxID=475081 RepID=A0A2Y9AAY1_9RHOB|nr:NAD(P)H-hydrate dehydratase [Jannaschia seohaensis]PWJ21030.1 hydroxyethylthiazole kinase-like uncharacterized protein yjeF/hydroxyethylthiazole kinase-like uncharacterized protein yjeF [Jannaschia seohaensis]SSA41440.1 yjeF C-terminal region, hydroxyethylthiazole kinase-related/yjeF N-terminal region [Jannaschia seohaensis]